MIDHLDKKKDDAIQIIFKAIASNFSAVFSELVPGGKGHLVIQSASKVDANSNLNNNMDSDELSFENVEYQYEEPNSSSKSTEEVQEPGLSRRYRGIDIKVRFPGSRETFSIVQLSGGQQTIVALSLIFAIQRCDPSPFYIFDEIDSNLDAVYRTAVANMIHKQSETSQFICTSFRPELLSLADQCFGVFYENKVSRVERISSEDAEFIISEVERELQ